MRRLWPLIVSVVLVSSTSPSAQRMMLLGVGGGGGVAGSGFTDNFDDDFDPRWTQLTGSAAVYDSTDDEMDFTLSSQGDGNRYDTSFSSIEHEVQVTWCLCANPGANDTGGPAARMRDDATTEWYYVTLNPNTDTVQVRRKNSGGTVTDIGATFSFTSAYEFVTIRLAAEGSIGSAVTLSVWLQVHGGSKPSDPGWIGVSASPDFTRTDSDTTSTVRHDQAEHVRGGISSNWQGSDHDTRHDYWKGRDISAR